MGPGYNPFRNYEQDKLEFLKSGLEDYVNLMHSNLPGRDTSIVSNCNSLLLNLDDLNFTGKDCWIEVESIKKDCNTVTKKLQLKLPLLAPRLVDLSVQKK